ncbi:MAG: chemotaxis protein CheW [Candidatus Eisenbacteria bacterium]|nr:chemotaxis protein CheW [Candidatus Eisenbacteria bacterium]
MPFEDEDLLEELIVESNEHLTSIEPDLLVLEKEGDQVDDELINRIFRAMHSIKGGFSFFGLSRIVDLSHAMESVLMRIRDGEMKVTPVATDALLVGIDKLRVLLSDVYISEAISITEELGPLNAVLEGHTGKAPGKIKADKNEPASKKKSEPVAKPDTTLVDETAEPDIEEPDPANEKPLLELVKPPDKPNKQTAKETPSTQTAKKDKHAEGSESIRVKVELLDKLMNLAGELVLGRNQIKLALSNRYSASAASSSAFKHLEDEMARSRESVHSLLHFRGNIGNDSEQIKTAVDNEFNKVKEAFFQAMSLRLIEMPGISAVMQDVDLVTSELQSNIMNTRMQPVGSVFAKFPRIMRDLAKKMNKEIELTLVGQEVELDKSIIEVLADPLTHLVRNCADHGIESPSEREQKGKPSQGKVRIRAYHEGGQVNIDITDDGNGIDPEKMKRKALERGLLTEEEAEKMGDREATRLIFAPGFSTAEKVSDVSGRGVGMDVVRTNIEKLGGTVEIESTCGEGTRINLRLPLTLAIIPSLIVGAAGRRYAMPQVNLEELVRVREQDNDKRIEELRGHSVLRLRGQLLPLVSLTDVLNTTHLKKKENEIGGASETSEEMDLQTIRGSKDAKNILILKVGSNRYGLIVDELLNNEEIVVKPLSDSLKECKHYAGSTIMGDGRVAMILDAAGISNVAQLNFAEVRDENAQARTQSDASGETQSLLLFRNSDSELFALNLGLVARIEKVRAEDVEKVGAKEYVKYDDSSMRILWLHDLLPVEPPAERPSTFFIIVPKLVKRPMGIIATKVEDILHTNATIDSANVSGPGILGSAVLSGRLAVLLDIYGLLEAAEPEKPHSIDEVDSSMLHGKRVLLAEDAAFFRSLESEYLKSFGCLVETANDGSEAWEKLSRGSYDLLVTDLHMPKMDGFELTQRVRTSETLKSMPVVAVTALTSEKNREKGEGAGVDIYELKLDKDGLRRSLIKALQMRQGDETWSDNSQHSSLETHALA